MSQSNLNRLEIKREEPLIEEETNYEFTHFSDNSKKTKYQQQYKENSRFKLKKRKSERRKTIQCLQNITEYYKAELQEQIVDANSQSSGDFKGTKGFIEKFEQTTFKDLPLCQESTKENVQTPNNDFLCHYKESMKGNEQSKEKDNILKKLRRNRERQKRYRERKKEKLKQLEADCIQHPELIDELLRENYKKNEYQKKYREQNREKLKQREKDRRKRLQCLQRLAEFCNIGLHDQEIDTNSQTLTGLEHIVFNFGVHKVFSQSPDPAI